MHYELHPTNAEKFYKLYEKRGINLNSQRRLMQKKYYY